MLNDNVEKLNIETEHQLDSGIKPIEVSFIPLFDAYGEETTALYIDSRINSLAVGTIESSMVNDALKTDETSAEYCLRIIEKSAQYLTALKVGGARIKKIMVNCPISLAKKENLCGELKSIIEKAELKDATSLCLVFGSEILSAENLEQTKSLFADIEAANISTGIKGFGKIDFPMTTLLKLSPSVLFLDGCITKEAAGRKRPAVQALIQYAKGLDADIVADGVSNDEELKALRSEDCLGVMVADDYKGVYPISNRKIKSIDLVKYCEGV